MSKGKPERRKLKKVKGDISLKRYEEMDEKEPQDLDYLEDGFLEFSPSEQDEVAFKVLRKMIRKGHRRLF